MQGIVVGPNICCSHFGRWSDETVGELGVVVGRGDCHVSLFKVM